MSSEASHPGFRRIEPYGGATQTHQQCIICNSWVPILAKKKQNCPMCNPDYSLLEKMGYGDFAPKKGKK